MNDKTSNTDVVGVLYDAWSVYSDGNGLLRKWMRFVRLQANPRDDGYMRRLFERKYPGRQLVEFDGDKATIAPIIEGHTGVVLLYPDAIGHGFAAIENFLMRARQAQPQLEIRVLNGRTREFSLDPGVLRSLRFRRLLERVPVAACLLIAVLLIFSPVLLLFDSIRGTKDVYR